jgi:hypothetical protein
MRALIFDEIATGPAVALLANLVSIRMNDRRAE